MKTVNVVLVSYFSEHEIENLIKSLLPESLASEKYELFFTVVSNGGDCSNLAFDTHIKVIQTGYNAGFAHGCNLGADSRETDLVLFCNPDIVIDFTSITKLIDVIVADEKIGILSPNLDNNEKVVNANFVSVKKRLPGAFYLMRSEVFREVGGWDDNFFLWGEDADLSYRVQKLGYKVGYSPLIYAQHVGGHSWNVDSGEKEAFYTKVWMSSQTYKKIKHSGAFFGYSYLLKELLLNTIRFLLKKKPYGRAHDNSTAIAFAIYLLLSKGLVDKVKYSKNGYAWQTQK